jgi:acyl carrier protein
MTTTIERTVRGFIAENFLFRPETDLPGPESLIEKGIVDSTGVLELVAFLEDRFGMEIPDTDIVPANLDSIDAIVRYVAARTTVPAA